MKLGWLIASSSILLFACSGGSSGNGDLTSNSDPNSPSGSSSSSSSSSGSSSSNISSQAEQVNGACPSSPQKLKGTRAQGASCSTYADCQPTCCGCANIESYLASACVDGACGDP